MDDTQDQHLKTTLLNVEIRPHSSLFLSLFDCSLRIPNSAIGMPNFFMDDTYCLLLMLPGTLCTNVPQVTVMVGYYMGLRLSEIINLAWREVDLKKGFIRLAAERTKTNTSRSIPLHPKVKAILETLPRGLHTDRVFLFDGKPFNEFKRSWKTALKNAGIENFVFHDLRHCALNNLRKAGNDFFQIMALSGHKTMSVFKRYNLVTEDELAQIKWPSQQENQNNLEKSGMTSQQY